MAQTDGAAGRADGRRRGAGDPVAWLQEINRHPVLGAGACLLLAVAALALRQLAHRSRVQRRLDGSFTLIVLGLLCGALATLVRLAGLAAAVPYLDALLAGAVAIGVVRALVTLFVDFYLSAREGAKVSAIFRDVASVVAYFLVIVVVLRSTLDINLTSLIATSAVLTVIVGLALQDVLSNLFSGLVLELEQPFSRGDWVRIGAFEGTVEETGWRTTKLRTRVNELVTLPNAMMSKEAVVNFSRPDPRYGDTLTLGAAYEAPPNLVKDAVLRVLAATPGVLPAPAPEVRVQQYGDSSLTYALRYWVDDFAALERIRSRILTDLWYALRRASVRVPFPARDLFVYQGSPLPAPVAEADVRQTLHAVPLLAPLHEGALAALAQRVRRQEFGAGEIVVRQGEVGDSFYVIERGTADVLVGHDGAEHPVGRLQARDFFGEMSLLAGEARTATVRAATDLALLVVDHAAFREILSSDPAILEPLSEIAVQRQAVQETERRLRVAPGAGSGQAPGAQRMRERIRAFFGL